jgi:hypothetical protein
MSRRVVVLLLSVALGASAMLLEPSIGPPARAATPASTYWFESDPGDPTARGRSGWATSADSTFGSYDNGGVATTIGISGPIGWLLVETYGPGGAHLVPGTTYEHARFSGYAGPGEATLAVHWSGEGSCNPNGSDGTLVVHDVAYEGTLFSRLSISFDFTCTGATGSYHGELRYQAAEPAHVALIQEPASKSPVDLGSVVVGGTSAAQDWTLTNVGSGSVAVGTTALIGDHPGDFAITADTCSGTSLAEGATCGVSLRFAPTSPGTRSAMLDVPVATPLGHRRTAVTGFALTPTTTTIDVPGGIVFQPLTVTIHTRPAPDAPPGYTPAALLRIAGRSGEMGMYDSNGDAIVYLGSLPPGVYEVTGVYDGSATLAPSESKPATLHVGTTTATSLTADPAPALHTEPITFTAEVSPAPPAGTLTLTDATSGTVLGSRTLTAGDAALVVAVTLPAGEHRMVAEYGGCEGFSPSSQEVVIQVAQDTAVDAGGFAVGPATFYPVVDGYLDVATATGQRNEPASVAISVRRDGGDVVLRTGDVPLGSGAYAWSWDGRDASGALQAAGAYRITQVLTDRGANTLTTSAIVTLSPKKLYWTTATVSLRGAAFALAGKGGGGSVSKAGSSYSGGVRLASASGWAGVSYAFTIKPAIAYRSLWFKVLGRSPNGRRAIIAVWRPAYGTYRNASNYDAATWAGPAYGWYSSRTTVADHRKDTRVRAEVVVAYKKGKVVFDVRKVRLVYEYGVLK